MVPNVVSRLKTRGFKQVDEQSCDLNNIHAPVNNVVTVEVIIMVMLLAGCVAHIVNVQGTFLCGKFEKEEKIYMKVSEDWEGFYPDNIVLLLLHIMYG